MEKTLVQLFDESNALNRQVVENHGVLTPELEKAIDELQFETAEKVDDYDFVLDDLKAKAEMLKKRAEQIYAAAKGIENVCERINKRIRFVLVSQGKTELIGNNVYFKLSKLKPKLRTNEELLPAHYYKEEMVPTYTLDKERLMQDIESGMEIPGVSFEESTSLRRYANTKNKKPKELKDE